LQLSFTGWLPILIIFSDTTPEWNGLVPKPASIQLELDTPALTRPFHSGVVSGK